MRYLIIDTEKLRENPVAVNIDSPEGQMLVRFQLAMLTEEESLVKFKEIWEEATESVIDCNELPLLVDGIKLEKSWEEYKKTL